MITLHRGSKRLALLIGVALASCSSPTLTTERNPDLLLQTDALEYRLHESGRGLAAEIPYTFSNSTGGPVYLVNCNGHFALRLERLEDDQWEPSWGPVLPECLSPPIVIAAGESFETTLNVWGAPPGTRTAPQFSDEDPSGVYRIVWINALSSYQDSLPFGEQIDAQHRISNRFVLTR